MKVITGTWPQVPNGQLALRLNRDSLIGGTSENAPRVYFVTLDDTGSIPPDVEIWGNDELMFQGSEYRVTLKDSASTIEFQQTFAICGDSPIDLTSLIFF